MNVSGVLALPVTGINDMHVMGTDGETCHDIAMVSVTGLDVTCDVEQASLSASKSLYLNKVHEDSLNEKKRTSSETPETGCN